MSNESEREYGWDDEIQNDGPEYVVLPDGDYNFKVTGFERGRYEGGEKIPACNMAIITLEIENDKGISSIQNRLFLHSRCEGLLCAFFTCIGQRKHGEKLKMNWNEVVGARGRAKIGHREYNGNIYNDIKRFYAPDESAPKKSFTPGKF